MLKLDVIKIDGKDAICNFSYDKDFEDFYRKETGARTVRKANVGKFIRRRLVEVFSTPNSVR